MKPILCVLILFSGIALKAQSPCTPNVLYADSSAGIWPYSGEWPNSYFWGQDIADIIDIKTPTDTCLFDTLCIYIKEIRIDTVIGLPDGFYVFTDYDQTGHYWQNMGNVPNQTGVQGCILLTASQEAVMGSADSLFRHFYFKFSYLVKNQNPNSNYLQDYEWTDSIGIEFTYLRLFSIYFEGLEELNPTMFSVGNAYPNPANDNTIIPFNTVKQGFLKISIYNALGSLVYSSFINPGIGKNQYTLNTSAFASGIYYYMIDNGDKSFTRKLVIK